MRETIIETIIEKITKLPKVRQAEVLDFIDFLNAKDSDVHIPDNEWSQSSLSLALRGMNDDGVDYTNSDIKIKY